MSQAELGQGLIELAGLLDSLDDACVIVGAGFDILQANVAAVQLAGRPAAQVIGQPCYAVLHGRSAPCGMRESDCPVAQVWRTGRLARATSQHFDANGHPHVTEITAIPLRSSESPPPVLEIVRDVTAQVQTLTENAQLLAETRRARDELDAIFNTIPDSIHIISADYRVVKANLGGARLQGMRLDEIIGRSCFDVFHQLDDLCEGCLVRETLATGKPGHATHTRLHADGTRVVAEIFTYPLFDEHGQVFQVLEYARDVTEQVHLQDELAQKARQLQHLLAETISVQEEERARIARDMHDGVTQLLIGALYETQSAREMLRGTEQPAQAKLERAQDLLNQVESETRRVISDLHPPILDAIGLEPALRRYVASCRETFDLPCALQVSGLPFRLSGETELAVYRIVQEALHNVVSHARANAATVTLTYQPDHLRVVIEDDGQGFAPDHVLAAPGDHFGLPSMLERAQSIGARLRVDSAPGQGTRIVLTVTTDGHAA